MCGTINIVSAYDVPTYLHTYIWPAWLENREDERRGRKEEEEEKRGK